MAASFSLSRPQSARLDGLATARKLQSRPKTPMIFGGYPDKTAPELVRLNPPPIWKPQGLPWKCESIPPPEQLRIHVKGQFGQQYLVKVYPEETFLAVKKQIKDQGGVFPDRQRLYLYNEKYNKSLLDTDVIGDFPGVDELGVRLFEELKDK